MDYSIIKNFLCQIHIYLKGEKIMSLPYPVILFRARLTPSTTEAFGPKTNQTIQGTNSPDNIVDTDNQTYIEALKAQRPKDRSTMMPSVLMSPLFQLTAAPNANNIKHQEYFVVAGQAAIDTLKLYCSKETILTYIPAYTGEGAAPGFDILDVGYFGVDPDAA
jgi:hypothetical protein